VIAAALRGYWLYVLAALVLVFVPLLVLAKVYGISGAAFWILFGTGVILAIAVVTLAVAYGMSRDIRYRLPDNNYGLCAGSNGPNAAATVEDPPLTDWLHKFFQEVGNRTFDDDPLTFGDLWGNGGDPTKEREIDLVLMTTNITRGISQRLPFLEGSWGQLFFKEEEFRKLFPRKVVDWMTQKKEPVRYASKVDTTGYCALPLPADLPILLGARMSLSFPFLLGAVPLYAGNVTQKRAGGKFGLERCWFSDGGLTSNFPIHFFDSPLPSRPTFGINLVPDSVAIGDQAAAGEDMGVVRGMKPGGKSVEEIAPKWEKIYMPATNSSGIGTAARFNRFSGIGGFFSALFDTARNWADTELMAMPGYRDRIVHVGLSEDEGGLNLNMPKDVIKRVGERGERAGELLAARFALDPEPDPQSDKTIWLTWENHRWVRFRSFMAALEDTLRRFRSSWERSAQASAPPSYDALLKRAPGLPPKSYPPGTVAQRNFIIQTTQKLLDCIEKGMTNDQTFDRGDSSTEGRSPRPKPVLRMTPPGSNDPRTERAD
jgi:hypothetical protein